MKTKVRFIVLTIVLALMTVGTIAVVTFNSATYTDVVFDYKAFLTEKDAPDALPEIKIGDAGVLKVESSFVKDGNFYTEFRGLREGNTNVQCTIGSVKFSTPYYVNPYGTVFQMDTLNFDGYFIVEIEIIAGLLMIFGVTLSAFITCLRHARYSYSMIAFGGVALFTLFVSASVVYEVWNYNVFFLFLISLLNAGYDFALVSAPLMLLLCFAIAFSNIWLIRHEGFRPQNMLGIVLSVVWILGLGIVFSISFMWDTMDFNLFINITYCITYIISFMACLLLLTIICAFLASKHKPPLDRDYLIILGCGIRADGTLMPLLRGRVDAAIRFEKEQRQKTGKSAKFIPSGGQGPDEVISESQAMTRYLLEQGYPAEQIIMEDKSVNTDQNIKFSCEKICADAGTLNGVKAGIATTNYHIFRGYVLAKKYNLSAEGISAKTKWYFFPNAFLREFVGLIVDRKWKIAVVLLLILLSCVVSAQLLYQV